MEVNKIQLQNGNFNLRLDIKLKRNIRYRLITKASFFQQDNVGPVSIKKKKTDKIYCILIKMFDSIYLM